jgi:hypothetical protein
MADTEPTIDVLDPMLVGFTIQHDFRERFLHALQEISEMIKGNSTMETKLAVIDSITTEALDPDSIQRWMDANRPLPWLDAVLGDDSRRLTEDVLAALGMHPNS